MLDNLIEILMINIFNLAVTCYIFITDFIHKLGQLHLSKQTFDCSKWSPSSLFIIVSSLQYTQNWYSHLAKLSRHIIIGIRSYSETAYWVIATSIIPCADQNEFRLELGYYGFNQSFEEIDIFIIAWSLYLFTYV